MDLLYVKLGLIEDFRPVGSGLFHAPAEKKRNLGIAIRLVLQEVIARSIGIWKGLRDVHLTAGAEAEEPSVAAAKRGITDAKRVRPRSGFRYWWLLALAGVVIWRGYRLFRSQPTLPPSGMKSTILEKSKRETEAKFREITSRPVPPLLKDVFPKHRFWNEHGILLQDVEALRTAIFTAGQRLFEEDQAGGVTKETEGQIRTLVGEAERLTEAAKAQHHLPPDIVEATKATPALQAAWTKALEDLAQAIRLFGQYAVGMEKMAKASRSRDLVSWNKLIGVTNVLAYKGPILFGQAMKEEGDFHTKFHEHVKRKFGFDPSARP